jgi:outer membrane protein OmpA-like peptidoglycan-associated protein
VVIDPLIDGVTGEQSAATKTIGVRIAELARQKYPQYDVQTFNSRTIEAKPFVILGTFTPVNTQNQPTGVRDAFRFCLIMADLRTGRVVARKWVRAALANVDTTPIVFFSDSPTWTNDPAVKAYIDFCQGVKVGDPISPAYADSLVTSSVVSDAIEAYDGGRYAEALELYRTARTTPAGYQLRVLNGLYIANWKLGRKGPAATSFGEAVDYGLAHSRLGVKILFRPGSISLDSSPDEHPYGMWISKIAEGAAGMRANLEVVGNTSNSGAPALNDRLSAMRAEYIAAQLIDDIPSLRNRLSAVGVGSANNLVGTGADDASDALDRRVEFKLLPSGTA